MLVAFIGVSGVGKSTITNLLTGTGHFSYLKNVITRPSRPGELHKVTYTNKDFDLLNLKGELTLHNTHFGNQYAYFKKDVEKAILDPDKFYIIEFGIENINQLYKLANTFIIILIPETKEYLLQTVKNIREERFDEIQKIYEKNYSQLSAGYDKSLRAWVVVNYINQQGSVSFKIFDYLIQKQNRGVLQLDYKKKSRLKFIVADILSNPPARNALEAYKMLTESINNFEDNAWGRDPYSPPRTFLGGVSTDRIYTIFPESFFPVPNYSGVTLLVSVSEIVLISRYGALEGQFKDSEDISGTILPFEGRKDKIFFSKSDAFGDGVWHPKNA